MDKLVVFLEEGVFCKATFTEHAPDHGNDTGQIRKSSLKGGNASLSSTAIEEVVESFAEVSNSLREPTDKEASESVQHVEESLNSAASLIRTIRNG